MINSFNMGVCYRNNYFMLFIFFICFQPFSASAQNAEEWSSQKQTQIRYLLKQIAGLKIYIELLQKGYSVVNDGINLVSDLKNGEFNLHKSYFQSLSTVNPAIRRVFHYNGPCREEYERLLTDGYYQLTDDERMIRLRELIQNCKR